MRTFATLALTGLTTFASASPISPTQTQPLQTRQGNGTSSAPCAQVSQFMYGDGTGVVKPDVPAQLAWECISTVAFNATSGKRLIKSLRPYIDWQSTLNVLKNPPSEYAEKVQPPVDIIGGLDKIDADIDAGRFKNEYDFGWTLYTLIQSAHDGHFSYVPDSVGAIFTWSRPIPLVSVSEDGVQLPAVFAFGDVLGLQFKNISYTPSPVVEIDGVGVSEYLENLSQFGSLQDRDALYNNVFYELAQVSLGVSGTGTGMFTGGGRGRWVYPGSSTTLKFANGSDYTMQNTARVQISFRNINSGEDLASKWFSWGSADEFEAQAETVSAAAVEGALAATPGFPTPVIAGPQNLINGFYIDAAGYEDVAVLQVPNFVGSTSAEIPFQRLSQQFIPRALADGKTKLIIDLQANGGGTILQGYDLFKQLFPDIDPYGANRFRAIDAVDFIGQAYSAFGSRFPRINTSNSTITNAQASYFDYHQDMTVDGAPFSSWEEKFGPEEVNGGKCKSKNVCPWDYLLTCTRQIHHFEPLELVGYLCTFHFWWYQRVRIRTACQRHRSASIQARKRRHRDRWLLRFNVYYFHRALNKASWCQNHRHGRSQQQGSYSGCRWSQGREQLSIRLHPAIGSVRHPLYAIAEQHHLEDRLL